MQRSTILLLALFGTLFAVLACGMSVAGYIVYDAWQKRQTLAETPPPVIPELDAAMVLEPEEPPYDPEAALAAMRSRYRPGPRMTIDGMLPSGQLQQARIGGDAIAGRTLANPFIVAGAELRPGAAPSPSPTGPTLAHGRDERPDSPLTLLPGVPARIGVHADGLSEAAPVEGLYIAFHDYPGHFFLPATVDTELGHIAVAGIEDAFVHFGVNAPTRPDGTLAMAGSGPFSVTMYIASVDTESHVSSYLTRTLSIQPVGTGDVRVALSMTESTDLDLYVVDPTGNVVYYANTTSPSGGQLDLDANAACGGNVGVNNEHVFWGTGAAPAGTYSVRVSNFESCIQDRRVDFRITVENCGEVAVLSGHLEGPGGGTCDALPTADDPDCLEAVSFDVTPCDPSHSKPPGI